MKEHATILSSKIIGLRIIGMAVGPGVSGYSERRFVFET
jgi:hypothetical protein